MLRKIVLSIIIGMLGFSILGCSHNNTQINANEGTNNKSEIVSGLEVNYINVDDGDSILVQVEGKNLLIDTGNEKYVSKVIDYLNNKGVKKLDYVIGSNFYHDYTGGIGEIIEKFQIGEVYFPKSEDYDQKDKTIIEKELSTKNLSIKEIKSSENLEINIGKAKVNILAPIDNFKELNNNSMILKLSYGDTAFLFTGSANKKVEKVLIEKGVNLKANVIKVAEHGSDSSTSNAFVKVVDPDIAIISVGKGSRDNPNKATLSTLEANNIKVYRTDLDENIVIKSDGKKVMKLN